MIILDLAESNNYRDLWNVDHIDIENDKVYLSKIYDTKAITDIAEKEITVKELWEIIDFDSLLGINYEHLGR